MNIKSSEIKEYDLNKIGNEIIEVLVKNNVPFYLLKKVLSHAEELAYDNSYVQKTK